MTDPAVRLTKPVTHVQKDQKDARSEQEATACEAAKKCTNKETRS
jgi:hypothetical protein